MPEERGGKGSSAAIRLASTAGKYSSGRPVYEGSAMYWRVLQEVAIENDIVRKTVIGK